jgi:hypothetical protein
MSLLCEIGMRWFGNVQGETDLGIDDPSKLPWCELTEIAAFSSYLLGQVVHFRLTIV